MTCQTTDQRHWHAAIENTIRTAFGTHIRQLGTYDPAATVDGTKPIAIETPAILIDLEDMSQADGGNRDRHAIRAHWSAHCILSTRTENLQIALREIATAVMTLVCQQDDDELTADRGNRWGLADAVEGPEFGSVEARPAEFDPVLHGHDSWIVTWRQVGYFSGQLPQRVNSNQ